MTSPRTVGPSETALKDKKVVIVGAGLAGLYGAYLLVQHGVKNITILEAQDRIGGRIRSAQCGGGESGGGGSGGDAKEFVAPLSGSAK